MIHLLTQSITDDTGFIAKSSITQIIFGSTAVPLDFEPRMPSVCKLILNEE